MALNGIQPGVHIHPHEVVKDIGPRDLEGLEVVFINMPLRESARPNITPEGPLLMLTRLRDQYGVNGSIIDLNAYRIQAVHNARLRWGRHKTFLEARQHIQDHFTKYGEPDLVCFSGKITTYRWQKAMARVIREILPDVFLVSGGGLCTELRVEFEPILSWGLFTYIPELDGIATGEGDDVIVKICLDAKNIKQMEFQDALNSGKLNPYYLGEFAGRHRFMYVGGRPPDVNALPFADLEFLRKDVYGNPVLDWYLHVPAWSVSANNSSAIPWNDEEVVPKTTSVSSRGCPFSCKYCFRPLGAQRWKDGVRSPKHLYWEITHHIEKYGIRFKGFPDDNFAMAPERIYELVPLLGPLNVPWGTHTRLDEAAGLWKNHKTGELYHENPLRVNEMARAGCRYIGFGPESASVRTLEVLGKGGHTLANGLTKVLVRGEPHEFPRSMVEGIQRTLDAGIHSNCTWIVGSPTETLEDVKESVLFMAWQEETYQRHGLSPESVNKRMFTLTWYPGTTIVNYPKIRQELSRVFGISFVRANSDNPYVVQYEPVLDENFERYMLELDDATKLLSQNGRPLNFSDMPDDVFIQIREHIDSGQTLRILEI